MRVGWFVDFLNMAIDSGDFRVMLCLQKTKALSLWHELRPVGKNELRLALQTSRSGIFLAWASLNLLVLFI